MDTIITILVEGVLYYLFSYPGAAIRWILSNKEKSFREILSEDIFINSGVGLLFLIPIIGGIILLIR